MDRDPFFWMTQDYEVEIRAREIQDSNQQELFCHNFGSHWSTEHKRFFRFPPKKVEKREDGSWYEVEDAIDFGKEYENYNRTPVGRALFLAKLEEAARLRCSMGVSTLCLVNFGKTHVYCSKHRVQNSTFLTSAELILAVDFGLLLSY